MKKLVENDYLAQQRSIDDRRLVHIKLTKKGQNLRDRLSDMHQRHVELLKATAVTEADIQAAIVTLRRLEQFWAMASTGRTTQYAA